MSLSHLKNVGDFETKFFRKITNLLQQNQDPQFPNRKIAIGYSGGLDSSVLLALMVQFSRKNDISLVALHINHSLSPNADAWQWHCHNVCQNSGIGFAHAKVFVAQDGQGLESAARAKRYSALGRLCHQNEVGLLLLAHHLDDQAETMLMQLFRGTGLRGLAGMDEFNYAPTLLGTDKVLIARPLLEYPRAGLEDYASFRKIAHIEDESNQELRYQRNAIRHLLMPVIEQLAPNFSERLFRTSQHIRSANSLLDEFAKADLAVCQHEHALRVDYLKTLVSDRVNNVFRHWLTSKHIKLPSTAKLQEILSQLLNAREDARVTIPHENVVLHRFDGLIFVVALDKNEPFSGQIRYRWKGESSKYFPELKGTLLFKVGSIGVSIDLLLNNDLLIMRRQGGERLRLAKNRPSRDMKSHFQSLKIPFWQREYLPFIYLNGQLFFVGLLGLDAGFVLEDTANCISLEWHTDAKAY